jgi:Protein of unknown function (DUF2398)
VNDTVYFDKLNRARVQALLNVLVEAPFFYRADDPELFGFLRRNRAEFARFYLELYGWELHVDAGTARLYKERWYNRALRPSQRDAFDPSRRLDCLGFLLVLEFYDHLLETHNLSAIDDAPPRFAFGELFGFARDRLTAELGAAAAEPEEVRRTLRQLVPMLVRYRFIGEVGREADDEVDDDRVLYEALPGLHHYDTRRLGPDALARAFGDRGLDRDEPSPADRDGDGDGARDGDGDRGEEDRP